MAEEQKKVAEKKKITGLSSARKRDLQSKRRQANNRRFKASVHTVIRSFEEAIAQGDKKMMQDRLNSVFSFLDKGVKTKRFKLNKVSRTKSRLTKKFLSPKP